MSSLGRLLTRMEAVAPGRAVAASQGTMNNITIGGVDPRNGRPYAYYETVGGGMGASGELRGLSGVHVHMTNTLNTPAEALEYAYPLRVTRYELRRGSGGAGQHRGGDGLVREIELLGDATVTILSERRRHAPYGMSGGGEGAQGLNRYYPVDGQKRTLGGKVTFQAQARRPSPHGNAGRRCLGPPRRWHRSPQRSGGSVDPPIARSISKRGAGPLCVNLRITPSNQRESAHPGIVALSLFFATSAGRAPASPAGRRRAGA